MKRELALFLAVLAILVLWFVTSTAAAVPDKPPRPKRAELTRLPVRDSTLQFPDAVNPPRPPFTVVTNETPHPRPIDDPRWTPAKRDLPDVWPPTRFSVSTQLLGRMRRAAGVVTDDDKASVALPEPGANAGGDGKTETTVERADQWSSFNRLTKGRVRGIFVKGKRLDPPKELPKPADLKEGSYYYLLTLLEANPGRAAALGVGQVDLKFAQGGGTTQTFPDEVSGFKIAVEGSQQGWFVGARVFVKLPKDGFEARRRAGRKLLEEGRKKNNDQAILRWAAHILKEARTQIPDNAQNLLRDVLLLQLEAATYLDRQEDVLRLGFEHLARFKEDAAVLEYMGNVLASPSYGLLEMAARCYARATSSRPAQQRRAAVLLQLGRLDEAKDLLDSGSVGAGADVALLRARVALALGDFARAKELAGSQTGGDDAADAYQIIGGALYASGDAAGAVEQFTKAVEAAPRRSTAYSDLGLAYAALGQLANAQACFDRALQLDSLNSVMPKLGAILPKITFALSPVPMHKNPKLRDQDKIEARTKARTAALDEAAAALDKLVDDNPENLLVRFYRAYAREKKGDLDGASKELRAILGEDHRYRVAIARLGIVESRRREEGGDEELVRPAIAHLVKAVELNPKDPTVAYILGRFLMSQDVRRADADRYLARAQDLPAPAADENLPLWAEAARAALRYRNPREKDLDVLAAFSNVITKVRRQGAQKGVPDTNVYIKEHPVGEYATMAREMIEENARKVDIVWKFKTEPKDWDFMRKLPMKVGVTRDGLEFQGQIDFGGQEPDHKNRLTNCCAEYRRNMTGGSFYEIHITGNIPENPGVWLGLGLVDTSGARRRSGRRGFQMRRIENGTVDVRVEGAGKIEVHKRNRAKEYLPLNNVKWPAGKFTVVFRVEDRKAGTFSVWLNGKNLFAEAYGEKHATFRMGLFGRARGTKPIAFVAWVEGPSGKKFQDVVINEVKLVRAGR